MNYTVTFTSQFKKDYKLAKKQNKNINKLFDVIDVLASGKSLEAKFADHFLTGKLTGFRECHIEPDWLLLYNYRQSNLILYRLGSHSELIK